MAIFSVYIRYFNGPDGLIPTERKMLDIPAAIGDPNMLVDPKVKCQMGKTGSFEFSIYNGHPYYSCWNQMVTMMRVTYFDETVFYGRVLTIDVDHITSKKTIHCEGYLAFLMDSVHEGKPDDERVRTNANTYISELLANHNMQLAGSIPPKQIFGGYLPGLYSDLSSDQRVVTDDNKKYGSTGWEDTASALETLTSEYGGYLRTRYVDGSVYLDWMDSYFNDTVGDRIIQVTDNVVSMSDSTEVDNIFTVLLPVGKSGTNSKGDDSLYLAEKFLRVPDILNVYSAAELTTGYHKAEDYQTAIDRYGLIYKTKDFTNADTEDKLRAWAWDWIKNNYHGGITSFSATAVDLKILGLKNNPILCGDRCTIRYPVGGGQFVDQVMTITSVEYDLVHPENTNYEIGIPDISNGNKTYGEKKASEKAGGGAAAKAGGVGRRKKPEEDNTKDKMEHFFYGHILSAAEDDVIYQEYKQRYGDAAAADILATTHFVIQGAVDAAAGEDLSPTDKMKIRLQQTLVFDGLNGTMTGWNPKRELLDNRVIARNDLKTWADFYAATASLTASAAGIIMKEDPVLFLNATNEIVMEQYRTGQGPRTVLEMNVKKWRAQEQAQQNSDQYGTIAIHHIQRGGNDEVSEANTTSGINGLYGQLVGGKVTLPYASGTPVDNLLSDKTGNAKGTVNMSGPTAQIDLTNLPQDPTQAVETLLFSGNGTNGEGKASIGKKSNQVTWNVVLNEEIEYTYGTDEQGNPLTRRTTGFVKADDFNLENVPSFKSTMGYVNTLLADYAQIGTLVAMRLDVDTIKADYITTQNIAATIATIQTLNTGTIFCAGLSTGGNIAATGAITGGGVYLSGGASLANAVSSISMSASGGVVTLSYSTLGGGSGSTNFNIADTQFYKDAVAAAIEEGKAQATPRMTNLIDTITSNCTKTYSHAGYDGWDYAKITVNVRSSSGGGGGSGCFAAGTLITMADGAEVPIEQLTLEAAVRSYDTESGQFTMSEVFSIRAYQNVEGIYDLHFASGRMVTITDSHPILTRDGWKSLDPEKTREEGIDEDIELSVLTDEDEVMTLDGYDAIEQIVHREDLDGGTMYNIDVEEVDTFVAGGIVAHNAKPEH